MCSCGFRNTAIYTGAMVILLLPDDICQLAQLETINVANNRLQSLPNDIGKMKSLSTVYCYSNYLTDLPHSLIDSKTITQIDCWDNEWDTLPDEIHNFIFNIIPARESAEDAFLTYMDKDSKP